MQRSKFRSIWPGHFHKLCTCTTWCTVQCTKHQERSNLEMVEFQFGKRHTYTPHIYSCRYALHFFSLYDNFFSVSLCILKLFLMLLLLRPLLLPLMSYSYGFKCKWSLWWGLAKRIYFHAIKVFCKQVWSEQIEKQEKPTQAHTHNASYDLCDR